MSKLPCLIIASLFAVTTVQATEYDAKAKTHQAAKPAKETKKCTPYGDESIGGQMCGTIR